MKKIYYKKGYLIKFRDGTFKLVNKMRRASYEVVSMNDTPQIIHFNTDYFIYSSPQTKYGTIPVNSIQEFFEVKWLKKEASTHIYTIDGKEFKVLN